MMTYILHTAFFKRYWLPSFSLSLFYILFRMVLFESATGYMCPYNGSTPIRCHVSIGKNI
jgi:hypothetical protein